MTLVISGPVAHRAGEGPGREAAARRWQGRAGRAARARSPSRRRRSRRPAPARADLPTHKSIAVIVPELWMAWRVPPATGIAASRPRGPGARRRAACCRGASIRTEPTTCSTSTRGPLPAAWRAPSSAASSFAPPNDAVRIRNETRARAGSAGRRHADSHQGAPALRATTNALHEAILRTALAHGQPQRADDGPRRSWSTSSRARRSRSVMDALAKITVDEIADFAGRYLKPDAARAGVARPEEVRNVTHRQSRSKKEARETEHRRAPSLTPRPTRSRGGGRRGDDGRPTRASAGIAAPRARPAGDGPAGRARGAGAPAVERADGRSRCAGPACRSCRCCSGFHADPQPGDAPGARVRVRAARCAGTCRAGPLDRGSCGPASCTATTPGVAVDVRRPTWRRRSTSFPRRPRRCTYSGPTPRSTAGSIGRRSTGDRPTIRRRARFAPRCSATTPTASTRPPRRRASSPNARRRPGSRACGAPRTACWSIVGDIDAGDRRPGGREGAARLEGRRRATAAATRAPVSPPPAQTDADGGARLALHRRSARGSRPTSASAASCRPCARPRDNIVHQHLAGHDAGEPPPPPAPGQGRDLRLRRRRQTSFRGGTARLLGHLDVDAKGDARRDRGPARLVR